MAATKKSKEMAVTKTLVIDVNDRDLDQLNADLLRTRTNMDAVEGSTNKVSDGLGKVRDNGGAISTLDNLTGGLATRIRDAAEATSLFNIQLKATRTALLATGIGAFLIVLGAVAAYWDEISEFITGANKALKQQISIINDRQEMLDKEVELLDKRAKLAELEGKSNKELLEQKRERIELLINETQAELGLLGALRARLQLQAQDVTLGERLRGALQNYFGAGGALAGAATGSLEDLAGVSDVDRQIAEVQSRLADLRIARQETTNAINEPGERPDISEVATITAGVTLGELQTLADAELELIGATQEARTRKEEAESRLRTIIAEREAMAKAESYQLAADAFATAGALIGQETAAGKALSVASAVISTYTAAQKAYESQLSIPTPDAPARAAVAAATAIAQGLLRVKQILSVKVPGGSGGGFGTAPAAPPAFNLVQNNPQNQLNQALLSQNREPVQAFVVENEVSSAQELRRRKVSASSL